jgi:hypothetical protein
VAYISITPSGGVEGPVLPKSTLTAAAGETVIRGQSGEIDVKTGDVVKLYLDGLAGDQTTPDTTVEWGLVGLAADEITAAAIAADAIAEIQAGLSTLSAAQVNAEVVDVLRTDTIPDSVPADGNAATIAQAVYMIWQFLSEKSVSGTTLTVKKPDGSTTLMTFGLDDASNPASISRAT